MISSFKDKDTQKLCETGVRTKNLIHLGEILLEEFLIPMGISQTKLSLDIRVPTPRVNAIVRGKRAITAIRRFGSDATSRWSRSSGLIFRAITTLAWPRRESGERSRN